MDPFTQNNTSEKYPKPISRLILMVFVLGLIAAGFSHLDVIVHIIAKQFNKDPDIEIPSGSSENTVRAFYDELELLDQSLIKQPNIDSINLQGFLRFKNDAIIGPLQARYPSLDRPLSGSEEREFIKYKLELIESLQKQAQVLSIPLPPLK